VRTELYLFWIAPWWVVILAMLVHNLVLLSESYVGGLPAADLRQL